MHCDKSLALIGLIVLAAALAARPATAATQAQLHVARHQLKQHEHEARRLQRSVAAEERRSREADQALLQRDLKIVNLRNQLREMRTKPQTGQL